MAWSPWDLKYNAEQSSERNDDLMINMNWVGLAHCVLPTFAFTNLLYIVVIRNHANKKSNIITNLFCMVLIGQLFVCFGYQVGYLYYDLVSMEFVIFAVLICQNIGFSALSFGAAMISVVYYYIIKQNYSKIYKLFYGNQRWHVILCYLTYVTIWLTLVCYHWIFVRIFFMIFIPGCLILHLILYCKLGGYCACMSCCNPRQNTNIATATQSVDHNNVYYKIGLFGSSLFVISFTVLPFFVVMFGAIPNVILAILAGISHCGAHVGFDYIASLDISNNIREKALQLSHSNNNTDNTNATIKPDNINGNKNNNQVEMLSYVLIVHSRFDHLFGLA